MITTGKIETKKKKTEVFCTKDMILKGIFRMIGFEDKIYKLKYKQRKYLVKRTGVCNIDKCNGACCKFFHISGNSYHKGFGKPGINGTIVLVRCKHLKKGKCAVYPKWPEACKQFPHPHDEMYHEVMKQCTFKFQILGEFK
jgi:Fe-S-cluster containining protein